MAERSERVQQLLSQLTVDEKADVVTGEAMWTTRAVTGPDGAYHVPQMVVTDGPNGSRGSGLMGTGTPTACIPAGSVLGATWDPDLLRRLGELLGDEAVAKGANVLLAPTINLHRNPLGGRNFECYSEDPLLTGQLAAAMVQGVQSRNVATTPKHFVGNDSEHERNTIDTQADERTLREVYLAPFEMTVKDGGAWGLMSAYNRLNGTFCSEHEWLMDTVLRDDWGFDGFVVSDWFAARSTAESVKAGMSLEMPGPGNFYGREKLSAALESGEITEADLDRIVGDVLTVLERTGAFDGVGGSAEKPLDRPEDRALTREASISGTVLLRNDGILPLDAAAATSIAVIGPNARAAKIMGGGSAAVRPYAAATPLEAITERVGPGASVRWALGANIDRSTPPVAAPLLDGALQVEFFAGHEFGGEVVGTLTRSAADFLFFGEPVPGVAPDAYSMRATGSIVAPTSGQYRVELEQCGQTRVLLDGEVALDATGPYELGDSFFSFGSEKIAAMVDLVAGQRYELTVEMTNQNSILIAGVRVGVGALEEPDYIAEAVQLATDCDVAVVVVGTNDDWETEGRDRDLFDLPGRQCELIERVAAVNQRTIVVVNTGGPHGMDWLDLPAAVLNVGFGGQSLGDGLADVLFGAADPGGRMPTTIPARYEHSPAYLNYPGENSVVRYGEGVHIGHRWFDARHIEPRVPFGYGLSYATFEWSGAKVVSEAGTEVSEPIVVEVEVTNTSDRDGSDVVQVYVAPPPLTVQRPPKELKGFAKVHVRAGETVKAEVVLDRRSFAYFDPGDQVYEALASMSPVPAKASETRHTEAGWYVEPGDYQLIIARSAADPVAAHTVTLSGPVTRTNP